MPIASDDLKLFGLDLRTLWHDVRAPWRKVLSAPAWSWLAPRIVVKVTALDGTVSAWTSDVSTRGFRRVAAAEAESAKKKTGASFEAILLPEELLLRRQLAMPNLDADQMSRALGLEAQNSTPFPSGDLVWGYATTLDRPSGHPDSVGVNLVLASRRRVEQFLATRIDLADIENGPEVWAMQPQSIDHAILLTGFGEAKRARQTRRYWRVLASLSAVVVALCVAIAMTPFLQLRARAVQANVAYAILDKEAAPAVAKREALLNTGEQIKTLGEIIGNRLDTLQVVQMLTKALPEDAFLQRLEISGRKVTMVGQAADAASLMQKLGAMPEVREVRAPAPAVRQSGTAKESFQIEFQLSDGFGVSEADAAVAAALKPTGDSVFDAKSPSIPASAAAVAASEPATSPSSVTPASSPTVVPPAITTPAPVSASSVPAATPPPVAAASAPASTASVAERPKSRTSIGGSR